MTNLTTKTYTYGVIKVTLYTEKNYYDSIEYVSKVGVELNESNEIIKSVGSVYLINNHPMSNKILESIDVYLTHINSTMNDLGFNLTVYQFNKLFNNGVDIDGNLVVLNSHIQGLLRSYHGVVNTTELIMKLKEEQDKGQYVSDVEMYIQGVIEEMESLTADEYNKSTEIQLMKLKHVLNALNKNVE